MQILIEIPIDASLMQDAQLIAEIDNISLPQLVNELLSIFIQQQEC
jgi:hypothetical protein